MQQLMKRKRKGVDDEIVYIDTSVIGGCLDKEFQIQWN